MVWLLGSVARQILKGRRHDPPGVLIILCILIGYVLECYSDNMHFYLSFNWYFWFVMGTICAWIYNEEKSVAAPRRRLANATSFEEVRPTSGYRPSNWR